MANEGILEVPGHLDTATRRFLTSLRNVVMKQQGGTVPPAAPTNMKVTPVSGGNLVQFTRPVDSDNVAIFIASSADISKATLVYLGFGTSYSDDAGKGGVKRFYWLRAYKGSMASVITGPLSGTSLALNTNATIPTAPQGASLNFNDDTSGHQSPGATLKGGLVNLY